MNTYKLSNTSISQFRVFLFDIGCSRISVEGGHEKWHKEGCLRPVIIQTHIDPIPEFIVKNNLRSLGLTRKDFVEWLKTKK